MELEKYSFGVGDRFGRQAKAQLQAVIEANKSGINIVPVWNKSHREHTITNTNPMSTRIEADDAVQALSWKKSYYCDADHINIKNVDFYLEACDYFTIDVADFIGKAASQESIETFVKKHSFLADKVDSIVAIDHKITCDKIRKTAQKILLAVQEASKIYRRIISVKGKGTFVTEISMDETDIPQNPMEMLFILAAIADEEIPAQTIAPRFTGRFNKGVDYVGNIRQFEHEFGQHLAIIKYAVQEFDLPQNLKLSIHSGSDKFSIYPIMNRFVKEHNCGLHVKTAGTTWLEEVIALAQADGSGLDMAKYIYKKAYKRYEELCAPYASVIDIDHCLLPSPEQIDDYSSEQFVNAIRHDLFCPEYNLNLRQLIHVGYKVAAELGDDYLKMLDQNRDIITQGVQNNILNRHILPIFG